MSPTDTETADIDLSRGELRQELQSDFTRSVVPLNHRKSQLNMTLVWITGCAGFSTMYTGYALRQGGLRLSDLILAALVGNAILLAYWYGACYLGAKFGQTETLLARSFLGRSGSWIVSAFIIVATLGWYSFQADLFGTAASTLLNVPQYLAPISLAAGLVMMANNVFGFTSVTLWARYIAAPVIIIWVVWLFAKVFATTSTSVLFAAPSGASVPFGLAAGTVLGAIIWGSEPDFWRWAKPRPTVSIVPSLFAITIGNLLFPIAGGALVAVQNYTDFGKVIGFAADFTLGISGIMLIVFIITQIAINDLNLYEVVTAAKNLFPGPRYYYVILFATIGAIFAYFQVINYYVTIASLTGILVPSATFVMVLDAFVVPRLFGLRRKVDQVPEWEQVAWINVPGVLAVAVAVVVGGYTAGIINPNFNWGIGALNAWVVAGGLYLIGVAVCRAVLSGEALYSALGYSHLSREALNGAQTAPVPQPASMSSR